MIERGENWWMEEKALWGGGGVDEMIRVIMMR